MVADVGSSIHDHDGRRWGNWPTTVRDWSARDVLELGRRCGLTPQAPSNQTPWKASFEVPTLTPGVLDALRAELERARVQTEIVTSAGRLIDVLPTGVGKGAACRYLATALSIPHERIVAAGDSGNDLDLLGGGFRAIVVGNAEPELDVLDGPLIYRAKAPYAAGVLEGIDHWLAEGRAERPAGPVRAVARDPRGAIART